MIWCQQILEGNGFLVIDGILFLSLLLFWTHGVDVRFQEVYDDESPWCLYLLQDFHSDFVVPFEHLSQCLQSYHIQLDVISCERSLEDLLQWIVFEE